MESKSHDSEELTTLLINNFATLSKRLERLEEQTRKQTEAASANTEAVQNLEKTVQSSNLIFDQVATGVKDLYEKVKTLDMVTKLMGNLGGLGPLLGSFGGQQKK